MTKAKKIQGSVQKSLNVRKPRCLKPSNAKGTGGTRNLNVPDSFLAVPVRTSFMPERISRHGIEIARTACLASIELSEELREEKIAHIGRLTEKIEELYSSNWH